MSRALLFYNLRTWTLNLFYIFQFSVKRQSLWYLWILHSARCTNFKHRLPTKYWTIQHETNCSNSPINTAFRRGIIQFCQLFHWLVYFDKPITAKLNYRYRCLYRRMQIMMIPINGWSLIFFNNGLTTIITTLPSDITSLSFCIFLNTPCLCFPGRGSRRRGRGVLDVLRTTFENKI